MRAAPPARHSHNRAEVGPVELFFDLVYVFAIIQLSHLLIDHLTWEGAAHTVVIFAAVWWGWNYTAWAMNWLNPDRTSVQILTGVLMVAALGMAIAIPTAFGDGAWLFVCCYLFMGILRPLFMIVVFRGQQLAANYRMLLLWSLLAGIFWVAGAALDPQWRLALWVTAVVVDYAAPLAQFRIPWVGSAPMHLWDTNAEHLAERNRLVFVIALGESILLMGGSAVTHGTLTWGIALSLIVGVASLFVLWWNYFALAGAQARGGDVTTGALRSAYAYAHALMVLGAIVVAVSTELRLTHTHLTPEIIIVTTAGPIIYLAGAFLFLKSRFDTLARYIITAAVVLVVIAVVALLTIGALPVMLLSVAVLAVTATLATLTALRRNSASNPPAATRASAE